LVRIEIPIIYYKFNGEYYPTNVWEEDCIYYKIDNDNKYKIAGSEYIEKEYYYFDENNNMLKVNDSVEYLDKDKEYYIKNKYGAYVYEKPKYYKKIGAEYKIPT